ncbi:hypothetical protein [Massilia rhizosphaerae]|uniref:hypothetical protein n=1 Tax=Massilia rhizosphaerae TaxID=2784389 RepID=UPI0018DE6869|nr:hypothetical protein [Massilia rhizosphaerae]
MKKSFFQKRSIGLAALASARDWIILLIVILGVLGLRDAVILLSPMDKDLADPTLLIGAFVGMLPSILICLPVHGVVDQLSRDALHSFLKSKKFTRYSEHEGTQHYTYNAPAWMRWDSNRVTIKPLTNGQLSVSMPFYSYRALKRWH